MSNLKLIISKVLRESVGVPDNIDFVSEQVFNKFIKSIDKNSDFSDLDESIHIIKVNKNIGDLKIKNVVITLKLIEGKEIETVAYQNASQARLTFDLRVEYRKFSGTVDIEIILVSPKKVNGKDIINFLKDDKVETVATLSHELKHTYDKHKKSTEGMRERIDYDIYSERNFPISTINKFLISLYYTTVIENLVRAPEVYTNLKLKGTEQNNFYENFMDNQTIKKLLFIRDYTYEDFIKNLRENIEECKLFLKIINRFDSSKSDDEIIQDCLKYVYINISNWRVDKIHLYFSQYAILNPFKQMDFSEKFENEIQKYKNNPSNFFKDEIFRIKNVAGKVIKKISKVYSLFKPKTNESIQNFDLYHKYKKNEQSYSSEIKKIKI